MKSGRFTKIETLSPGQEVRWQEFRRNYRLRLTSTIAACDRSSVEEELTKLYKDLKLDPPQLIWCRSPKQMILLPAIVDQLVRDKLRKRTKFWFEANLRGKFWRQVWQDLERQKHSLAGLERVLGSGRPTPMWSRIGPVITQRLRERLLGIVADSDAQIRALIDKELLRNLSASNEAELNNPLREGIRDPLREALRRESSRETGAVRSALGSMIRTQVLEFPNGARSGLSGWAWAPDLKFDLQLDCSQRAQFASWLDSRLNGQIFETIRNYWTMLSLSWLAPRVFLNEFVLPVRLEPEVEREMQRWTLLSEKVFGLMFFENAVFISERPSVFRLDDRTRIHSEDGPSLEFSDGFCIHSWHGTLVPEIVIERPEEIAVATIDGEQNAEVKRVMIERFGQARYLAESGALKVHEDEFGELYAKQMDGDEPLVMVKLKNSTPEPDGTYKYYFLRVPPEIATAREAVAWTFGMKGDRYRPAQET